MLSLDASSVLILGGIVIAIYLLLRRPGGSAPLSSPNETDSTLSSGERPVELLRWQVEMHETARELKGELDCKLAALQALVLMARQESERLEAAIETARSLDLTEPRDTLAAIERLADPAALASATALADAACQMPPLPSGAHEDLFQTDHKSLAISRLAGEGLSPGDIAHRLRLPIGEVELRLSLRPA